MVEPVPQSDRIEQRRETLQHELDIAIRTGHHADVPRLESELRALPRVAPAPPASEGDELVRALEKRLLDLDRDADRVQLQGAIWAAEDAGRGWAAAKARGNEPEAERYLAVLRVQQAHGLAALQSKRATAAATRALAAEVAVSDLKPIAEKARRDANHRKAGAEKARRKRADKKREKDAPLERLLRRVHTNEDGGPRPLAAVMESVKCSELTVSRRKVASLLAKVRKPMRD